jgi:hypothetical protein
MDDAEKKPESLERARKVRRNARIVYVVCNAIILAAVWVVIRNVVARYDQSAAAFEKERTTVHLLFFFITMGLLASCVTTAVLAFQLSKLEAERDI